MSCRAGHAGAIATMAVVCMGTGAAWAQPAGPIIVGERDERLKPFELTDISAALEFRWERRYNEQTGGGSSTTETTDTVREFLDLSTRSFIGHPNLIDLIVRGQIGLQDVWVERSPGSDQHDTNLFDTYDVTAGILSAGPAPLTLFARRTESLLDRQFGGSLDSSTEEYGGSLLLFRNVAPTRLTYTHRVQDLDDPFEDTGYSTEQDTVDLRTDIALSQYSRLAFEYTYDQLDESRDIGTQRSLDQHNALLTHSVSFGKDHADSLRSSVRYFQQDAEGLLRLFRIDEALFLRHSDTLDSRYSLSYDRREDGPQVSDFVRGTGLVRHRLYESLVTTATVGGSHRAIEDFTSDEYFGSVLLDYTKKVPYGRLNATLISGFNRTDNSEFGDPILVQDQRELVPDIDPVTISRRNVDAGSIIVTDETGFVYREGIDYTIRVLPDRVEIFPIVGGDIDPGEIVLVDYTIEPEPENTIDTLTLGSSARYAISEGPLRGLGLYFSYTDIDQEVEASGFTDIVTDDLQILRYGADHRIGNFFFLGEIENRDSEISPSDTMRFQARYIHRIGVLSRAGIDYTYQESDYTDQDRTTRVQRLTGRWYQTVTRDLDFRLRLIYRDEENSFSGDTQGFEQDLEVNWRHNQTSIFASIRNSILEGDDVDTTNQTIIIGLRREF